jgi:hypothetical protein
MSREKGGDGSGAPYPHVAFKSRPLASVTATQKQPKSTVTAPRLSPPPRRLSPPSLVPAYMALFGFVA